MLVTEKVQFIHFFFILRNFRHDCVYSKGQVISHREIYYVEKMFKVLYNLLFRKQIWHSYLTFSAELFQITKNVHSLRSFVYLPTHFESFSLVQIVGATSQTNVETCKFSCHCFASCYVINKNTILTN